MVVGRSGLAAEINFTIKGAHIHRTAKGLRSAAAISDTSLQEFLHIERSTGIKGLYCLRLGFINNRAVAVNNLCYQNGINMHTVVGHRGIGVDEFEQVDITRTERQRRRCVKLRLDAHFVGGFHYIRYAHLLAEFHGDGVHTLCKSRAQGQVGIRECAVGVMGLPNGGGVFPLIINLHADVGVFQTRIAWRPALLHRCGINEEFES